MKFLTEIHLTCKTSSFSSPSSKHFPFSTISPPELNDPIITNAVSILKHHRSKSRWSHLRTTTPPTGFTPSQVSQITLQLRNTPHLAFRFFHFTLQHSLCDHTISTYATIIHVLSRSRHKFKAQEIIQAAFRKFPTQIKIHPIFETLVKTYRACDSAPFVFDLLVKACIESKRVDQAVEIVRMLRCKNVYPSIGTCNDLIELMVKSRGCFAAYDVYREIFRLGEEIVVRNRKVIPNANTFNAIMVGFYREALVEKVEEVWAEMERVECEPDAYSYSIVMAAYCDDGRMEDAIKVWEGMESKGVRQDVVTYNTLIGGFCSVGEMERAEELFQNMVMSGLGSTCVSFEHLMKGYCKVGNVDSALLLYKDMSNKGLKPESTSVDEFITLLCDKNEILKALQYMRVARKKHDYNPSKKSYELVIEGLCAKGKVDDALKLQVDMVAQGYEPDSKIYDVFIHGYMVQGNQEMAILTVK
ncbi:hypothetical protein Leryth_011575 [Lithospermum erythrorhizon]|nr:hypothetical protein Leryth_011575 [Lithospermum erythrorhizon]